MEHGKGAAAPFEGVNAAGMPWLHLRKELDAVGMLWLRLKESGYEGGCL